MEKIVNALVLRKAFVRIWTCIVTIIPLLTSIHSFADTLPQLTFLTWEDYIDDSVVEQFEQEHQVKVNFVYFESDDGRDEILTTYTPANYDLIMVDSVSTSFYQQLGWIKAFDVSQAPNLNDVALPKMTGLTNTNNICTPYFWGTTGIAYRKDLVEEPITSWKQLFEPAPELKGKILMPTVANESVGAALKYLGYSMNSNDKVQIEQARQVLLKQAPMIAGYSAIAADTRESKLVTGEVSALVTYSGDALMLKERLPYIEYVLPEEGGGIWVDLVCLSAEAQAPGLAHKFIDFINQPEQATANALYVYGASLNKEAHKLLPKDFLDDNVIYPDKHSLARSELYQPLESETIRQHTSIMNELKRLIDQ